MTTYLMVPLVMDALWLQQDRSVAQAMADFSVLPFTDGARDFNSDFACLSENVVSQPFADQNLHLKAGVHLHWALPDTLTHSQDGGASYPALPNRWLVTRSKRDGTEQRRWIVESDYLYPDGEGDENSGVSVPLEPAAGRPRPYRFMGRTLAFEAWNEAGAGEERLVPLTAVGYGDPSFAAFYPNCASLFGFHDGESADAAPGYRYDVVGWHANGEEDELGRFVAGFGAGDRDALLAGLEEALEWTYTPGGEEGFPTRILCYSRITFDSGSVGAEPDGIGSVVAVGNTGTEALAARLADLIGSRYGGGDYRATLEDQLEALALADTFHSSQTDVAARFKRARHEQGFASIPGGTLYRITRQRGDAAGGDADAAATAQGDRIDLPEPIERQLNALNLLRRDYDRNRRELESRRKQLFWDWYKYMLCAYPPEDSRDDYPNMDEVRHFLQTQGIDPITELARVTGEINVATDGEGRIVSADGGAGSLAQQVAAALTDLVQALDHFNGEEATQQAHIVYGVKEVAAPVFHQPADPVVLLEGMPFQATPRHGQDGILECGILEGDGSMTALIASGAVDRALDDIAAAGRLSGVAAWSGQPWDPYLLQWEAQLFPLEENGNLGSQTGDHDPAFIEGNFIMKENEADLCLAPGKGATAKGATIYRGATLLSDAAGSLLQSRLEDYLKQQVLDDYYSAQGVAADARSDDYLTGHIADIVAWYEAEELPAGATAEQKAADPVYTALQALAILVDGAQPFYSLAQSLGGFHEALLMSRQTLQVAIDDPLGFPEDRAFAQSVAQAVGESISDAPEPANDFNPIRSGTLEIGRLRVVDTFGRFVEVDPSSLIPAHKMKVAGADNLVALAPRLAQPARLNFHWLSALSDLSDEEELDADPIASPICGWFLTNHLDNSLMVYDGAGTALGSINRNGEWEGTPGDEPPLAEADIANSHLRDTVGVIRRGGVTFLEKFIRTLDSATANIEPDGAERQQGLSLLVGRPLALARVSLDLEVEGLPRVHQGWNAFRQDLHQQGRETNRFEEVRFPIRLGDYRQLNDGLAGYWIEAEGKRHFYAPQAGEIEDETIVTRSESDFNVLHTVRGGPAFYTLLLDPRGTINATSGTLPASILTIPPVHYEQAIKQMAVYFLTAPILTQQEKTCIPLPEEGGLSWSWLEKRKGVWSEISDTGTARKGDLIATFAQGEAIWGDLIAQGWILSDDGYRGAIVAKDARSSESREALASRYGEQLTDIEIYLDSGIIGKPVAVAEFQGDQRLAEGWLKLHSSG